MSSSPKLILKLVKQKSDFKLPEGIGIKQKKPQQNVEAYKKIGDDLLSRLCAVPLALVSLTSLFGMGRGGTSPL